MITKDDLVEKVAARIKRGKREVDLILNSLLREIMEAVAQRESVSLTGFGQFISKFRSARRAVDPRNPRKTITVPAVRIPKFKAGKTFKDLVKGAKK
jgi:DNA-binding protein HU-beta